MLEHLPKVWSKDLQHRHHLGTWWICRVSSPTQGCYVRIFLLRSSPGKWCAWKFEKHHSSQIHLFSKYSLSSYSELDLGIQQKISPTPSSKTCSLVSKVGKHMGYWGGATFFESGDGELRSGKASWKKRSRHGTDRHHRAQCRQCYISEAAGLQFGGLKFREEVQVGDLMCVKMLCKL